MIFWPVMVSSTERFMVTPSIWPSHTNNLRDYTGTSSTDPLNMPSMEPKFVDSGSLKNGLGMVRWRIFVMMVVGITKTNLHTPNLEVVAWISNIGLLLDLIVVDARRNTILRILVSGSLALFNLPLADTSDTTMYVSFSSPRNMWKFGMFF